MTAKLAKNSKTPESNLKSNLNKSQANVGQRVVGSLIKVYQSWSQTRPPSCRFIPTCSQYCAEAIEIHGVVKGGFYTAKRLCKCHPLGSWGYDPPPLKNNQTN